MVKHILLLVAVFITTFYAIDSTRKAPSYSVNSGPIAPQPSQYTTSILLNGNLAMYYADTTVYRDRLDQSNQNYISIVDFQQFRQYVISRGTCSWAQIPGKITPMLLFPTYKFNGVVTHNSTSCYQWSGCHGYEIPPAPFDYYATVKGNIPVDLNLPTIDVNMHFFNFTFGPPPPNVFDIPSNCTNMKFNPSLHPIFSQMIIENSSLGMLC